MKNALSLILKFVVALAIFAGIFVEFGGGYAAVKTSELASPGAIEVSNPAYPGIVGRVKARLSGRELPPPRLPSTMADACRNAGEGAVFVRTADGQSRRIKTLRHCGEAALQSLYVQQSDGSYQLVPLAQAPENAFVRLQGFQLVPAELSDLWAEIKSVKPSVFVPWFLAAMAIKLVGIFANIWRWQILLAGQGIEMKFGFLTSTYFIGRYFGIVTPSTMGLDAWRLYETARLTKKPIECTTALAVERIIGLVGLLATILLFMPFAGRVTQGQSFGEMIGALKVPLAGAMLLGVLVLLQPAWFTGLIRLVPNEKARRIATNVVQSATAYSHQRGTLLFALVLAVVGQVTTTLMYFCNAMSIAAEGVHTPEVLFASAVMTLGTFIAPSASGEGVRELVFVWLLGSKAGAVKAFLIGNLGFWIEKVPLSVPGGIILLMRNDPTIQAVTREDLERVTGRHASAPTEAS
ncbi:MAG TPA: lysylphosphatidylglycerol synthase transmembrane domain-containing protein [Candidatus Binatia bacterium]|jgi:uncharacterized membrane protein YbhN (UPF0104 family)